MTTETTTEENVAAQVSANNRLRDLILSQTKRPRVACTLWGQEVEVLAGSVGEMLEASQGTVRNEIRRRLRKELGGDVDDVELEERVEDEFDAQDTIINKVISQTVAPGTDDKIFTEADKEAIKQLPDDGSITAFLNAFNSLSEVNINEAAKKSEGTPSS